MPTKNINLPLSEEEHEEVTEVKDEYDMTWQEFILKGAELIEDSKL